MNNARSLIYLSKEVNKQAEYIYVSGSVLQGEIDVHGHPLFNIFGWQEDEHYRGIKMYWLHNVFKYTPGELLKRKIVP